MNDTDCKILVIITAPNLAVSQRIAQNLVENKLAACVNILPGIQSVYRWEDKILNDLEYLLIAKTRLELFDTKLLQAVQEIHPYEVPEIIALPIQAGLADYLEWIQQETQGNDEI